MVLPVHTSSAFKRNPSGDSAKSHREDQVSIAFLLSTLHAIPW